MGSQRRPPTEPPIELPPPKPRAPRPAHTDDSATEPSMPSVTLSEAEPPAQFPHPKSPPAPEPRAKTPSRVPLKDLPPIVETRRLRTPRDSGIVIRARTPTGAPPLKAVPAAEPVPAQLPARKRTASDAPAPQMPAALRNKLSYAITSASLGAAGIEAVRENGTPVTVFWAEITSIVARRLPADPPYDGFTFIDIASSTGRTMRLLPWTKVDGDLIAGEDVERARSFVRLTAQRCPQAHFDEDTSTFLVALVPATQLADRAALAAHDRRLL